MHVRFLLNNQIVEVGDVSPTVSVLTYLRTRQRRCGTKEGCAEGDCGACTVVIGELHEGDVTLKAVNACIQFLPTLDGKALFTVEDLRAPNGALHPVQQSMVDCHASQCGFCTPGFVMSLWALYLQSPGVPANDGEVRQAITGNLCRCTGYRPIIEAGKKMGMYPVATLDRAALKSQLLAIQRIGPLHYAFGGQRFFAPRTLEELVDLRAQYPQATLLAGGTDVGLWVNKQLRLLDNVIYTGEVDALKEIGEHDGVIRIGAAVSLSAASVALCLHYPETREIWERFASMPIRNVGTLGGNIANGSPIGDSMPALIALGATVTLASKGNQRTLALEDLYLGYQQQSMCPDEVLAAIEVPTPDAALRFRTYKISKRFDSDISAVCAAFALRLNGDVITRARIAFGGMAATPLRALKTEAVLHGKKWNDNTLQQALACLADEFTPLSDFRASREYRATIAGNLLKRFYLETRDDVPLAPTAVSVFA